MQEVEQEFPNDLALQQVHFARKIISRKAELLGMSFLEYIENVNNSNNLS